MSKSLAIEPKGEAPARRGRGAPAIEYSVEIAEEICERVANGKGGLRSILDSDPSLPNVNVVIRWLNSNAEFADAYARAKQLQADFLGEDILDIIDDPSLQPHDKRIRFEGRKWLMSKLKPRVYGDSIDVTSKGEALAAPVINQVTIDQRVQTLMLLAAQRKADEEEAARLLE